MNGISDMIGQVHGGHMTDYAARMEEARAYGERRAELEHAERRKDDSWWMVEKKTGGQWQYVSSFGHSTPIWQGGYHFCREFDARAYLLECQDRDKDGEYRVTDHGMTG